MLAFEVIHILIYASVCSFFLCLILMWSLKHHLIDEDKLWGSDMIELAPPPTYEQALRHPVVLPDAPDTRPRTFSAPNAITVSTVYQPTPAGRLVAPIRAYPLGSVNEYSGLSQARNYPPMVQPQQPPRRHSDAFVVPATTNTAVTVASGVFSRPPSYTVAANTAPHQYRSPSFANLPTIRTQGPTRITVEEL